MADLNVALILRLVDRATGPARAAMRAIERIGGDSLVRQAAKAQAASAMIAGGVGSIAGTASRAGLAVAAYGTGVAALAASFVRPAAQFEQFNVQLTTLEGSSAKARKALAWITTFATKTPLSVEQTVRAYAKLKAFGLDPTTGSLQAMVDTMAATGGGAEQLEGLTLALGQAWSKGKLQGEEAMQMLERGVPVWDLLAKKLGKTTAEVQKMSEQGKLGREEIILLMDALEEKFSGASDRASQTWDGMISNLGDQWTQFQLLVMDSGLFDWMKGQLQDLLDTLTAMAKDGTLLTWAKDTGTAIKDALVGIKDFGTGVYETLDKIQAAIGGWDILGWTAALVAFAPSLVAVGTALGTVAAGVWALSTSPVFLMVGAVLALAAGIALLAWTISHNWPSIQKYMDQVRTFDEGQRGSNAKWGTSMAPDLSPVAPRGSNALPTVPATPDKDIAGAGRRRALGGPVRAGAIYQWQEQGRELFVPNVDGTVISNRQLRSLRGGPGRAAPSFTIGEINITAAAGQSVRDVAAAVRRELEDMARGAPLHDGGAYAD